MARLIGYVRVSTDDQATHGFSIPAQIEEIGKWAKNHGHDLVGIEIDDGVSGGIRIERRPGGYRVLQAMNEGRADGMVAVSQDRIYRDDAGWALLVAAMDETKRGIYVTSRGPASVVATQADRLAATFMSAIASGHRLAIKEHTTRALRGKRERGEKWTKNLPLTAKMVGKKVVDDPHMMAAAQFAAKLYEGGMSLRKIGTELVIAGFANSRSTTGTWHPDSVRSLVAQKDGWRNLEPGYTGPAARHPRATRKPKATMLQEMVQHAPKPKKRKAVSR